jgi:hypothetical protein
LQTGTRSSALKKCQKARSKLEEAAVTVEPQIVEEDLETTDYGKKRKRKPVKRFSPMKKPAKVSVPLPVPPTQIVSTSLKVHTPNEKDPVRDTPSPIKKPASRSPTKKAVKHLMSSFNSMHSIIDSIGGDLHDASPSPTKKSKEVGIVASPVKKTDVLDANASKKKMTGGEVDEPLSSNVSSVKDGGQTNKLKNDLRHMLGIFQQYNVLNSILCN